MIKVKEGRLLANLLQHARVATTIWRRKFHHIARIELGILSGMLIKHGTRDALYQIGITVAVGLSGRQGIAETIALRMPEQRLLHSGRPLAATELKCRRAAIKGIDKSRTRGRAILDHNSIMEGKVRVRTDNRQSIGGLISQNLSP